VVVYLVEAFRSRHARPAANRIERARAAALGRSAALLGRFAVPADEIEFWLFDAASRDDLAAALAAVDLGASRISEVEGLLFARSLDGPAW
jgi:hypothetical protein